MSEPREPDRPTEEELRWLLADAVSDIDPADALSSIHDRTKVTPMSERRPWLLAVGGAVLATAAVVTAVAFAGGSLTGAGSDPQPADHSSSDRGGRTPSEESSPVEAEPSQSPSEPSESPAGPAGDELVTGIYYVGDTPRGPRLYREFHGVDREEASLAALRQAGTPPDDPDYRTVWSPDDFEAAGVDQASGILYVSLSDPGLRQRPSGMAVAEAEMAVQALVYTMQAVTQSRDPVQFRVGGQPVDQVLGVRTPEPLTNAAVLDTLSHVSITSPAEGDAARGVLEVTGVANSFEANVVLQLRRPDGEVLVEGFATAEGWMGERLFPFRGTLDSSGIPAGDYLVVAMTDDASGGAEGPGAFTDTRRVTVD